jgi:KaiC/GvpD/RAD55 family RecA-like ATPase
MAKQALSVSQLLAQKKETFELSPEWKIAFGEPEVIGTWIIWGQSGNGKTTFALSLAKELSRHGVVLYNSLEEGASLSLMNAAERVGLQHVNRRVRFVCEDMDTLLSRLKKRRSPKIVFIDSFQYTQMSYKQYIEFKEQLPNHLLIFVSHADGNNPSGRSAKSVMYDSMLKIWVEGYRAFSKGRFIGERGWINIWEEAAQRYWEAQ